MLEVGVNCGAVWIEPRASVGHARDRDKKECGKDDRPDGARKQTCQLATVTLRPMGDVGWGRDAGQDDVHWGLK